MAEVFKNQGASTLSGSINNSQTTITVADASSFPSSGTFTIVIESEYLTVTGVSGNDFTVTRGENSSAASHASGLPVRGSASQRVFEAFMQKGNNLSDVTSKVAGNDALHTQGSNIASASTTDLSAATGELNYVTGTTTITGLGTCAAGVSRTVIFSAALVLTHNATSLILPGGANITTAANDIAIFRSLGSGNWICAGYRRASSAPSFSPKVEDYTSTGASTIPVGAKTVKFIVIGGGGGGGSGRRGNSSTNHLGGSGGSGGGVTILEMSVADIGGAGTALTVTVGTGGAGGAARTSDDTDGAAGSDGVDSSVTRTSDSEILAYASRGMGGAAGIAGTSSTATGVTSSAMFSGASGGGSSSSATATSGSNSGAAAGGGGGGGGLDTSATPRAGGTGGAGGRAWRGASTNATGGAATGGNGTDAATPTYANVPGGGGGGGGAGTGAGGAGAAGKHGGGGGGGAASVNTFNSGAGGSGGDGFVRIIYT